MPIKLEGFDPSLPVETLGLGVFDGMHRGHQDIVKQCSALLTLDPHPDHVLGKAHNLKRLSTLEELRTYCTHLIVLPFSEAISQISPEDFLNDVIRDQIKPKKVVVGYDYHYGYRKRGNVETLKEWGSLQGIDVQEVPAHRYNSQLVKSATIRDLLLDGHFDDAIDQLGHSYLLMGTVKQGEGRGRQLGFPTANLLLNAEKLIPSPGVYKGQTRVQGQDFLSMIYIGSKPTFSGKEVGIEVHILDFHGDLYGQTLSVFMEAKLRGDMKFSSADALVQQIQTDISHARQLAL